MAPTYDAQSIQAQVMDMDKMLLRVMTHVTRMAGGQTSQILRDLTQISSTINTLKHGVTGYVEAQQRQAATYRESESAEALGVTNKSDKGLERC